MAAVKKALYEALLVAGTLQTLSNLFFYFDIYAPSLAGTRNLWLILLSKN
jgi:hypothetical protein